MIDDCFFVINWAREELLAWLSRVWTYLNTSAIIRTTAEKLCWFGFKRYYENVYLLDVSSNELIWQVTIKFCSLLISAICWFDILRSASDWKGNDDWDCFIYWSNLMIDRCLGTQLPFWYQELQDFDLLGCNTIRPYLKSNESPVHDFLPISSMVSRHYWSSIVRSDCQLTS